jgi:hypothetical protein
MKTEPANTEWRGIGVRAGFERAELEMAAGQIDQAAATSRETCAAADSLFQRDRSVTEWRTTFRRQCLALRAKLALRGPSPSDALPLAQQALTIAREEKDPIDRAFALASSQMLLSDALRAAGQNEAARGALQTALAAWPKNVEEKPRELAQHAALLTRLEQDSRQIKQRLAAMGYRHPEYRNGT